MIEITDIKIHLSEVLILQTCDCSVILRTNRKHGGDKDFVKHARHPQFAFGLASGPALFAYWKYHIQNMLNIQSNSQLKVYMVFQEEMRTDRSAVPRK